ncbi:MAG: 6-phosphofructokinase [Clostridia bacterium]|nr:6-phosphofructokinase [Clostridia bacterium]
MKNCLVAQSGGPTAAINATLAGVIKGGFLSPDIGTVYGAVCGIEGVLNDNLINLNTKFCDEENLKLLIQTPASYLGSCRKKLPAPDVDETPYKTIFSVFQKHDIGYFFYIGGNDSMDTVDRLNDYAVANNIDIKIMGVPKTIDNDLPETDHTPGFGSAAKYIAASVREMAQDANVYDLKSVLIIELMGRNAGWLTAASVLARTSDNPAPHFIYLPENPFDLEEFLSDVLKKCDEIGNVVVCVSEGIKFADGTYVCESTSSGLTDVFNHKNLSGTAKFLENAVRERLGIKARAVEMNVSQRCASHLASKTDLDESVAVGQLAVSYALAGASGEMMTFKRLSHSPYEVTVESKDIKKIANLEKTIPSDWITRNDVLSPFITYIKPLIQGEPNVIYKDGLPVHITR